MRVTYRVTAMVCDEPDCFEEFELGAGVTWIVTAREATSAGWSGYRRGPHRCPKHAAEAHGRANRRSTT
jgi:hypothetical protein